MVSIIIPVYNTKDRLKDCILSVIASTYNNLDIILIDDGSSDNSGIICDDMARFDHRIRVFHTANHGVSAARNFGIQHALGQYISFVDSDDVIHPQLIETLITTLISTGSELSITPVHKYTNGDSFTVSLEASSHKQVLFLLENDALMGPTAKLYLSSVIINHNIVFPEDCSYGEDMLFNLDYLCHIQRLNYTPKHLYDYTVTNNSSLSKKTRWTMFDNDMMLYRKLELWSKESDLWSKSFQTFIADRRFDIAYNSILLVFRTDCLFSEKEKKTYINRILHHPDVIEAVSLADTQKYAHWITFCIRHKLGYMLILAAFFKRLLIKELV